MRLTTSQKPLQYLIVSQDYLNMASRAERLEEKFEPRPDPQGLTGHEHPAKNSSTGVDYEPHRDQSIKIPPEREEIIKAITSLYSGSASEDDMQVYAAEAIYDDPWSYCDTRYKIAGQWYGKSPFLFTFRSGALRPPFVYQRPELLGMAGGDLKSH